MAARRVLVAVALVAGFLASLGAAAADEPGWQIERDAGADRYATSAAASARAFPGGAGTVVVASGEVFADALAATPAAVRLAGPLLLTRRDALPDAVVGELRRLRPTRIVLVGGTAAVSEGVEWALARVAAVQRLAGPDRFTTAVTAASEAFMTGPPVAFLANGRTFPDALAAGNVAARLGGGTAAVGEAVRQQLAPHDDIDRIGGRDRYETAARLVAEAPAVEPVGVLASGRDFADALSGGPAAAALGGSLVIAAEQCRRPPPSRAERYGPGRRRARRRRPPADPVVAAGVEMEVEAARTMMTTMLR